MSDTLPVSVPDPAPALFRFGRFELDTSKGELRREGKPIRLRPQPLLVLARLASQPGEVVTREEIKTLLWGNHTYVDFEQGLNSCMKQVRAALGDDAENPVYVQTLPRRGYRFLAPVERLELEPPGPSHASRALSKPAVRRGRRPALALAAVVLGLAGFLLVRPGEPTRIRLVVLPFDNLGASGDEFLSDGLTDEIITQLGRAAPERLAVIARSSALRYKGPARDARAAARELAVDYLVEGTVRASGGRVRITAKLVRARDQTQVWADAFERRNDDILALQGDVARALAQHLELSLTPGQAARLERRPADALAYEAYLRGMYFQNRRSEESLRSAIAAFEEAVARQPDFAPAHAGLGNALGILADHGHAPASELLPRAEAEERRAIALDPRVAEAHAGLGVMRAGYDWDWAGARTSLLRALAIDPNDATVHQWYSEVLRGLGQHAESLREAQLAHELDPLSLMAGYNLGEALRVSGRAADAVAVLRKTVALDPLWSLGHEGLGRALIGLGSAAQAVTELETGARLGGGGETASLAFGLAHAWRTDEAEGVRRALVGSAGRYVSPYNLAVASAAVGDKTAALLALEQAADERVLLVRNMRADERLASLRNEPRFTALVRRIGLAAAEPPVAR